MKQLKPIILKESYYTGIEAEINNYFYDIIYKPMIDIIKKYIDVKFNSINVLITALLKGKIQYIDGKFSGSFNSKTTKEFKKLGAKFNKATKTWSLPMSSLPADLKIAMGQAQITFENMTNELIKFTENLNTDEAIKALSLEGRYIKTIDNIETDFKLTAKSLEVVPDLTVTAISNIAKNYSNNMDLYIKKWTEHNISKLRKEVSANVQQGFRASNLVKDIQKNYGVSKNKAKFLAKNETMLLTGEYTQQRYKDVGVNKYRWSTSKDSRVRSLHKELNGKVFSWDAPPIIDEKTGKRGHPKQTFRCRCKAIPLLS